jgi:hypothetical protein
VHVSPRKYLQGVYYFLNQQLIYGRTL